MKPKQRRRTGKKILYAIKGMIQKDNKIHGTFDTDGSFLGEEIDLMVDAFIMMFGFTEQCKEFNHIADNVFNIYYNMHGTKSFDWWGDVDIRVEQLLDDMVEKSGQRCD